MQWGNPGSRSAATHAGMTRSLSGRHGMEKDEDTDGLSVGESGAVAGAVQEVWS